MYIKSNPVSAIQVVDTGYILSKKYNYYSPYQKLAKISSKVIAVLKNILIFAPANKKGVIAQLVEQRTENPCVPGSIPGGTTFRKRYRNVAQLVAHYVRDVGVGRSSRLIPTIKGSSFLFFSKLPPLFF